MTTSVLKVVPGDRGKSILLSGNMSVLFEVEPADGFFVRFNTADVGFFEISTVVGHFVNLSGNLVKKIKIGGALGVAVELTYNAITKRFSMSVSDEEDKIRETTSDDVIGSLGPATLYGSRSLYDTINSNGSFVVRGLPVPATHDLLKNDALEDPLTGRSNFSTANVGQPLVPIANAVSAPYWTDPGPLTLNNASAPVTLTTANLVGQLDFVTDGVFKCVQFTSKAGYGGAAGGKRRVQLNSYEIGGRQHVAWDLSFKLPEGDDLPYRAANPTATPAVAEYKYPMLIWQLKGGEFPTWSLNLESVGDGIHYDLYITFLWSSIADGVSMYRQYHGMVNGAPVTSSGNINGNSNVTKYFVVRCKKNEWVDLVLEMYLDERDTRASSSSGYGGGFCNAWINGKQVLAYTGPTLQIRNQAGAPCPPHAWNLGIYRHESSVPSDAKELDLNRQVNPAPYQRRILFRRARMLRLPDIQTIQTPARYTWANRPTAPAVGTEIQLTDYGDRIVRWDGTVWVPSSARPWVQGSIATHTGVLGETLLAAIPIPPGMLGANGMIRVTLLGSYGGTGGGKGLWMRFGPNNSLTGAAKLFFSDSNNNANVTVTWNNSIRNRGAANSQVGPPDYGASSLVVNTAAIDTNQACWVLISGVLYTTLTDSITIHHYSVELLPHA